MSVAIIHRMKTRILERYRRSPSGELVLDITAARAEDLYNNFDKQAPYVIKELDADLVDYIIDSAQELGREPFMISFNLEMACDEHMQSRIRTSIRNYFLYLQEVQQRALQKSMRTTALFMLLGFGIMFLSVLLNQNVTVGSAVITHVLAEGLTVAAWVALWQAIANLLIDWWPEWKQTRLYENISNTRIEFKE